MNLGAGRVVKQDLVRIAESIEDGSFFTRQAFLDACTHVAAKGAEGGTLHRLGLIGDGPSSPRLDFPRNRQPQPTVPFPLASATTASP